MTLKMKMVLKRKIMSELLTTYFPTLLLTAITFATTFFKPFFFEAALSVNLTTMLVMTTIFISKMESLPLTSDIKMIDIWLIFCQLVPFSEVVLLTAIEYLREDQRDLESKQAWKDVKRQQRDMFLLVLRTLGGDVFALIQLTFLISIFQRKEVCLLLWFCRSSPTLVLLSIFTLNNYSFLRHLCKCC